MITLGLFLALVCLTHIKHCNSFFDRELTACLETTTNSFPVLDDLEGVHI